MTELQARWAELSPRFEAVALEEYRLAKGKLFRCGYLCGYSGDYQSDDVRCDVIVRLADTDRQSILHWNDEFLDPYWDVDVVHWISKPQDLRSTWIDGPSHNMLTGERQWKHVTPVSRMEYLKIRLIGLWKEE